ncbi:uncharacterized protein Dana_GF18760 [Drosophila ananassae]|uniref:Uncharacterized protein n=2 Tax=Drosophila ananassae TaxID=7217 RepID=B3LY86_DROAN|nr:uncharacterized protein Dana_GF18760 [Drosophila ananassae]
MNVNSVEAANILGIFPYRHSSTYKVIQPLMQALVAKGHNLTIIAPSHISPDIDGVRHIRVDLLHQHLHELMNSDQLLDFFRDKWREAVFAATFLANTSAAILSDDAVQKMLSDKSERFDMVMIETAQLDAVYGMAEYYNATLVGVSYIRLNWSVEDLAGNPAPSVLEPISPMGFSLHSSLFSRIYNWVYITEEKLLNDLIIRPAQLRIFKKFFGYSAQKMEELRSRFSVILVNNHFSFGRVRSNVPNIIEIAGIHLSEPPEPCGQDLQQFLDEAEHGVIYFSLGLDIMLKLLPQDILQPLEQTFSRIKQRVVWKTDDTVTPNQTGNIYRMARTPQRMILSHPKTRIFITHGGILSLIEAIDSGVPMLGIPFFFDQLDNLHKVQQAGMARVLDTLSPTADTVTDIIRDLIEEPKYAQRAKEMSSIFKDRPISPLDSAVWWTEYALRHRDARLMRINESDLSFMVYYKVADLLPLCLRIGVIFIFIIFISCRLIKKHRTADMQIRERNSLVMQKLY